jgi:hypothetical protein
MSKEITLPSGATVKIRDAKTLKHKDRMRLFPENDTMEGNTAYRGYQMFSNTIAVIVEEWSFDDLILPNIKPEILGELEIPDYDALVEEAKSALEVLFPKTGKTIEAEADPKAPTDNSKG